MAKDRQHFIPRTFQRGFLAPELKGERVWVLRRTGPAHARRIADIGLANEFYSPAGGGGLDAEIQKIEDAIGPELASFRNGPPRVIDPHRGAFLVDHLTMRTAHVRGTIEEGAKAIAEVLVKVFGQEGGVKGALGISGVEPTEKFSKFIVPSLLEDPRFIKSGLPLDFCVKAAFFFARENLPRFHNEMKFASYVISDLIERDAKEMARKGHARILSSGSSVRYNVLCEMCWKLEDVSDFVVLPDCVALCLDKNGYFNSLILAGVDVDAVVMPITSRRLIVGRRRASEAVLNFVDFNRHAAAASQDFIISDRNGSFLESIQSSIGSSMLNTLAEAVSDVVNEALFSHVSSKNGHGNNFSSDHVALSYDVLGLESAGEDIQKFVFDRIDFFVKIVSKNCEISCIDGFDLVQDVYSALNEIVVRENSSNFILDGVNCGNSFGVPVLFFKDEFIKVRFIVSYEFIQNILYSDNKFNSKYVIQFIRLISYAGFVGCMRDYNSDNVFTNYQRSLNFYFDPLGKMACSNYFSSKIICSLFPVSNSLGDEFVQAVEAANLAIPAARLSYRFHKDIDKFFSEIFPYIREIIRTSAEIIGSLDLNEAGYVNIYPSVQSALARNGLEGWFQLFVKDLSETWGLSPSWSNAAVLGVHGERLLWLYGVYVWPAECGRMRVEVPIGSDAHRLPKEVFRRFWSRLASYPLRAFNWLAGRS